MWTVTYVFLQVHNFVSSRKLYLRPAPVALLVASRYALPGYSDESGYEAQAGRIIVSGYSGICFKIKFSGRHRGFDDVLFKLSPLANTRIRGAQSLVPA